MLQRFKILSYGFKNRSLQLFFLDLNFFSVFINFNLKFTVNILFSYLDSKNLSV